MTADTFETFKVKRSTSRGKCPSIAEMSDEIVEFVIRCIRPRM